MRNTGTTCAAFGGAFGVLCPTCIPALAVLLPTVGLGFLADATVTRILLLIAVAVSLIALHRSALVHRQQHVFIVGVIAAMGIIAGRMVFLEPWLIYGSSGGLLVAAVLDWKAYRRVSHPKTA
ncbi:MAG: MerC domain-containing protein [bacterium]|nr:MerC domain-containing protein [bacterium]